MTQHTQRRTTRRRTHLVVALSLTVAALAGCSIQPEASPRDIPAEAQGVFGGPVTGDEAAGTNRIFLLAPNDPNEPERLRAVSRDVPSSPSALLQSLFAGPNADEREARLDTVIPNDIELLSARPVGQLLTVDVNDVFDELTTDGLRLAVAQIVTTATVLPSVQAVELRVEGEDRVWPRGNGELTDRPLTAFDYPGVVESSQPDFPGIPSPAA